MKPIAAAGALALLLTSCSLRHPAVEVGQTFPQMDFERLDGSTAPLALAPGRVTFVNVFATWCPPCKEETPALAAFAARGAAIGVDVVGIDQEETPTQVQAFAKRYGIAYPIVIDRGRATKDVLGARIIPRTIVVDGKGVVRAIVSGPMTDDQMRRAARTAGASS